MDAEDVEDCQSLRLQLSVVLSSVGRDSSFVTFVCGLVIKLLSLT